MDIWLAHPAVQAAGLPFLVALAMAWPLARTRWLALPQAAGFAATATLAIGWSLESLTSTRKLALAGVAAILLCALIEMLDDRRRTATALACIALAAATVWMLWRLLAQQDAAHAVLTGVVAAGYVAAQGALVLRAGDDPVRAAAAGAVLAWGTGVVAILGASAVLGTVALAAGSAAIATLGVQFLRGAGGPAGRSIALPAAAVAALAGANAVLTAELPWYALLPLLLVVPAAQLAPATLRPRARALSALALAFVPAAAAVALAWFCPA
jgi:hypothetical protein